MNSRNGGYNLGTASPNLQGSINDRDNTQIGGPSPY